VVEKRIIKSLWLLLLLLTAAPLKSEEQWFPVGTFSSGDSGLVVRIKQLSSDLKIKLEYGDKVEVLDSPDSHLGTETVWLPPTLDYNVSISVAHIDNTQLSVEYYLQTQSANEYPQAQIAEKIHTAALEWHKNTPLGMTAAKAVLLEALEIVQPDTTLHHTVVNHLAQIYTQSREPLNAIELINTLEGPLSPALTLTLAQSQFEFSQFENAALNFENALQTYPTRTTAAILDRLNIRAQYINTVVLSSRKMHDPQLLNDDYDPFDELLSQAIELNAITEVASLHAQKVTWYFYKGDLNSAIAAMRIALTHFQKIGDNNGIANMLNNLGYYHHSIGDLDLARSLLIEALARVSTTRLSAYSETILINLASVYEDIGDKDRAKTYFHRVLDLVEVRNNIALVDEVKLRLAKLNREEQPLESIAAHKLWLEQLQTNEGQPDIRNQMSALLELARDYQQLNDLHNAKEYAEQAWNFRDFTISHELSLEAGIMLSDVLYSLGDVSSSLEILIECLDKRNQWGETSPQAIGVEHGIMLGYASIGDIDRAIFHGDRMVTLTNHIGNTLDAKILGPKWSDTTQQYSANYAMQLIDFDKKNNSHSYTQKIISVLESTRALQLIRQRNTVNSLSIDDFSHENEAITSAWNLMIEAQNNLVGVTEPNQLQKLQVAYYEKSEAFELLVEQDRALGSEEIQSVEGTPPTISIDTLYSQLSADKAVIQFILGSPVSYAVVSYGDSTNFIELPDRKTLSEWTAKFRDELTSNERLTELSAISEIFQRLVRQNIDQIYIIPQAELYELPFAAIPIEQGKTLVDEASVVLIPVISEALDTEARNSNTNSEIVVFSDPSFETLQADTNNWSNSLQPLSWSQREASSIEQLFAGHNLEVYSQNQFTKSAILSSQARNASILHLATHAYYNKLTPEVVGLATSEDLEGHNFLSAFELSSKPFNSDLVVISGCDTAQGEVLLGEGPMSLSRMFLAQGANSAVGSIWPIDDKASAYFMSHFYEQLKSTRGNISIAFQNAQQKTRQNRRYKHPKYWAGYVLNSTQLNPKIEWLSN